ncbi:MAG: vWA domain-containing protein [Acidobacteriota bacterium]
MRREGISFLSIYLFFYLSISILYSNEKDIITEFPKPLDVFLAIDQSGSMKSTDPNGIRISSAKYFVDFLASQRSDFFNHRVGIINFGDRAPENLQEEMLLLNDIEGKKLNEIKNFIKPMDLGNTSFISALKRTYDGFKKVGDLKERQKALVFFTDGEPDDKRRWTKEQYFSEIRDFVNENFKDCTIYVVAIDVKNTFWDRDEIYWNEITKNKTYKISKMDEKELEKLYSSILLQLLKSPDIHWDEIPGEGLEIEIEPYLEKVTFSILKENPDVNLVIIRNDGKKVEKFDPDTKYFPGKYSEIYSIDDPFPGNWRYKIEKGKGKVEVGKAIIPVEVRLISPYSPFPQGKEIEIKASFLKRDKSIVKENPAYRLWLGAKIINPKEEEEFIEFLNKSPGIYIGKKSIVASQIGRYTIETTMKGGNLVISQKKIEVSVEPIPYLDDMKPLEYSKIALSKDIKVEAKLKKEGTDVNPSDVFIDDPNSLIFVQISDFSERIIKSIPLKQVKNLNKFEGIFFKKEFHNKGTFKLIFQLSGNLKTGVRYKAYPEEVIFIKRMTFIDFFMYRWYFLIVFSFLLLIIWDWSRILRENEWWLWRFSLPKLSGEIEIKEHDKEPLIYYLYGKRKFDIGKRVGMKCGYIAAVWRKTEEGLKKPIPKIRYSSTLKIKKFDEEKELEDRDSVTIKEKFLLEYRS